MILNVFALTIYPASAKFHLIRPSVSDTLITGSEIKFEWGGSPEYRVAIYVSYDNGISWDVIAEGLKGLEYNWKIPWPDNLKLQFKIVNQYTIPPHLLYEINTAHKSEIRSVQFAPDDNYFLTSSALPEIKIWKAGNLNPVKSINLDNYIKLSYDAAFYKNSDSVLVAGDSAVLLVLPVDGAVIKFKDDSIKNIVRAIAPNPAYGVFASASNTGPGIDDGVVAIYDIASGKRIADFRAEALSQIRGVSFSADGKLLCYGAYNGKIYICDWQSGEMIAELSGHGDNGKSSLIYSCNFNPESVLAVSSGGDQTVRVWDISANRQVAVLEGHQSQVWKALFHPDKNWILSASLDSMIIQWDYLSGSMLHPPLKHGGEILSADYSPDGSMFLSAGRDNSARLWKNFEEISDSIIIAPVIKYPATLTIPDLIGYSGDLKQLQLILELPDSVPQQKIKGLEASFTVEYPAGTIYLPGSTGNVSLPKDTITGNINLTNGKNLLINKIVQLLQTDIVPDSIRIAGYNLNSGDFQVSKSDGLVVVLKDCIGDYGRSFYMSKNVGAFLSPNPAEDLVNLALSLPETGNAIINICDVTGNVVKSITVILDKNLKKNMSIDLNELQNGSYYIFIQSNNMMLSRQLKIFR